MDENYADDLEKNNDIVREIIRRHDEGWKVPWIEEYTEIQELYVKYIIKKYRPATWNNKHFSKFPDELVQDQKFFTDLKQKSPVKAKAISKFHSEHRKTYEVIFRESAKRRADSKTDTECRHELWITRCSTCGEILDSDKRLNNCFECKKIFYNDFEKLVCSYHAAKTLKELKVRQYSTLYYVYYEHNNLLTLRTRDNLKERYKHYSAFTCQELSRCLLSLPDKIKDEAFYIYLAKHSDTPNALANMLIRILKNNDYETDLIEV
jgi:hypothetical protein